MQAYYGNKFLDMWRDGDMDSVKQMWANEMGKLTNEQLKRGFDSLITREWPPTLPEYIKLCKPSTDATKAYYEAVNGLAERQRGNLGDWSHPAIYWAATKLAFDLKSQPYSSIKARWEKTLSDEMDKGEWPAIPEPMIALPPPGKAELSKERAKQMLTDLGASEIFNQKGDPLRWARKILQRVARGEVLPDVSIKSAKEVLGEPA